MKIINQQLGKKKQGGLVLLVMVLVIFLAISSYYFSSISITEIKVNNVEQTQLALKQAKRALIAYAEIYNDVKFIGGHGILPCPDYNNGLAEGLEDNGNCGVRGISKLGFLPWRTLGLPPLKDDSGTCLMYAVTGQYKNDEALPTQKSLMLNEDTFGTFDIVLQDSTTVIGGVPGSRVVALVFAPGKVLPYQARAPVNGTLCGREYTDFEEYLDRIAAIDNSLLTGNVDDVDEFVHAISASEFTYNDQFLAITRDEIWQPILARSNFNQKMENLTHALASCLAEYANLNANDSRRLPWPVIINLNGADYRDENNYQDDEDAGLPGHGYSGRFPFDITESNAAINNGGLTDNKLMEIPGLCDALDINGNGSVIVDLATAGSEYRELWNNWKDHFFYTLSKEYSPANSGESDCGLGNCISVNALANKYAAAVIYSGTRLAVQARTDKAVVADYLEDGKSVQFTNESFTRNGFQLYLYTDPQTAAENDIMYCVEDVVTSNAGTKVNPTTDPLTVVECS